MALDQEFKELQSLALDIRVLDEAGETVDLSGIADDDAPTFTNIEDVNRAVDNENKGEEADDDFEGDDDFDGDFDDEEFDSEEDEYAFDEDEDSYDDEE